ncbi:MAG: hypothetical protein AAF615_08940 [Pseudomonadota bacterium]
MKVHTVVAATLLMASTPLANAADKVTQAGSFGDFEAAFCTTDMTSEHVFVVPSAVFSEHSAVNCSTGEFGLRTSEVADDPGHAVYNIDPPSGVQNAFDCDAKADVGMTVVALNCLPVSAETSDHNKT